MKSRRNKSGRVSNNTGWHVESAPGQPLKRISHNPRLSDTHPELATEWHPSLNGDLTPYKVTALSTYRAWWRCEFGHEWQRQVNRRALHGSGCPLCELEAASLATLYPQLAKEWSDKNGDLRANQVRPSYDRPVWWKCRIKHHEDYQRPVNDRSNREKPLGCQVCEGTRPERSESFGYLFPQLLKEWHPKLNGEINPYHHTPSATTVVWWRCVKNKEHEWSAPIYLRTLRNPECPYCRLWYVTDENRLSVQFPDIAAEWHPKKNRFLWPRIEGNFKVAANLRIPAHLKARNRRLRPSDVATNCDEIIWWKCSAKGHEWQMSVQSRAIGGRGCPECKQEKLATEESLAALFPAVARLWHPTRNLPVRPTDIVPGSTLVAWWRCPKSATHVWKAHVYSVVRSWKDGTNGCRWCCGLSVDDKNSLQNQCPAVAKLWHPSKNGKLTPSQVTVKSNKRVWWHCGKPKHEFESRICNMVLAFERGRGNGCVFCCGRAVAPDNSLKRKYPLVAKMWHPRKNGKLTPSDVTCGSEKVIVWMCDRGHDWPARIRDIVKSFNLGSEAKGCPHCYGKKASKENNLWDSEPEAGRLWDAERNMPTRPWEVTPGSSRVFFWRCQNGHSWQAKVSNVVAARRDCKVPCPECRRKSTS